MWYGIADGLPGFRIPESSRVLPTAARQYDLAVRAEGHGNHLSSVLHGCADGLARGRIPEPCGTVFAARQDDFAVGAERHGKDLPSVPHGAPMGWRVAASQSCAALSSQPVSTVLPSGLTPQL